MLGTTYTAFSFVIFFGSVGFFVVFFFALDIMFFWAAFPTNFTIGR